MSYVIGVDQGGSGTRAAIATLNGRLLGTGIGPGACHIFSGMEVAMSATQAAVQAALDQVDLPAGRAEAYAGGHTGADWADEYDLLRTAVRGLNLAKRVRIVNDSIIALRGGTEQPYGAILVAGTGANCALRAPDGREFIYHYYHDDALQGGDAIGRAAVKAIFRAETGRPPQTTLRSRVLAYFNLPDVDTLMRDLVEERLSTDRLLEIAPLVFAEAARGDQAAGQILTAFGEGCAELLINGLQRLEMSTLEVEVVLSGGIFKSQNPIIQEIIAAQLKRHTPKAHIVLARYEPVVGAVLLALEEADIMVTAEIKANIDQSARALGLIRKTS